MLSEHKTFGISFWILNILFTDSTNQGMFGVQILKHERFCYKTTLYPKGYIY